MIRAGKKVRILPPPEGVSEREFYSGAHIIPGSEYTIRSLLDEGYLEIGFVGRTSMPWTVRQCCVELIEEEVAA